MNLSRSKLPEVRLIKAEKARRRLHEFVRQSWSVVEPAMPFMDNWHVGAICEHLQAIRDGQIHQLLINIPPGHAKSLLVDVFWPAWMWIDRPEWRAIFSSYDGQLAVRDSVRCRTLIESVWYQRNFALPGTCAGGPSIRDDAGWGLSSDQNVKGYFTNTRTGARLSVSVGSKATGFRGNCVATDDPLNAMQAPSKLTRDEAIFWWDKVMSTRLNDPQNDARVLIMQRLHEDDPAGHVLAQGGYEHLCLPSEFEPKRRSITFIHVKDHVPGCPGHGDSFEYESIDPVTGNSETLICRRPCSCKTRAEEFFRDPRTEDGELLFPTLFPKPVLEAAKVKLGATGYAGQHQQRPAPEDGDMFKKASWRFWKPDGTSPDCSAQRPIGCWQGPARPLPTIQAMWISLDCTFKDTDGTDFVVFQVWGANKADRFLLDQVRGRMSFTRTLAVFRELCKKWPHARRKFVEDKANGSAVIDTLQSEIAGIIPVTPEGGKEARAHAVTPEIESGNVYLPDGAPWLEEFIHEFTLFPNGKNDDQVDALSQALIAMGQSSGMSRAIDMVKS